MLQARTNSCEPVASWHTQLSHPIESGTLDARLNDLARHGTGSQGVAKDKLQSENSRFRQGTAMIPRLLLPALAAHLANTAQILVAWQGRLLRVAMLPDVLTGQADALL